MALIRELVEADILAESGERLAFRHDLSATRYGRVCPRRYAVRWTATVRRCSSRHAIAAFDEALAITGEIGASWDTARIRRRLRRGGARRRVQAPRTPQTGWPALTRAEVQVVQLVTQGMTNREIAEHLFISPHTVSAHLRHIFDKMGVKSRVQPTIVAAESTE